MVSVEKNIVCVPVSGCWDRIHGMGCAGLVSLGHIARRL
jgi:hypothetical protein